MPLQPRGVESPLLGIFAVNNADEEVLCSFALGFSFLQQTSKLTDLQANSSTMTLRSNFFSLNYMNYMFNGKN
jgi:hypothetical protein